MIVVDGVVLAAVSAETRRGLSPTEVLFLVIGVLLTIVLVALFTAIAIMVRREERAQSAASGGPGSSASSDSGNDARGRGSQA